MAESLRRPFKLIIVNHVNQASPDASKLNEIIQRFAVHVRQLEFRTDQVVGIADIEFVLRPMTNLTELTLNELKFYLNDAAMIGNIPIVLPRLEKISVNIPFDMEQRNENCIDELLCMIKAVALKEFTAFSDNWLIDYTEFFTCNQTIKSVTLSGDMAHSRAFERLQLTHLRIFTDDIVFRRNVIKNQSMLQQLIFLLEDDPVISWCDDNTQSRIDDADFAIICGLTRLETLRIEIGKISPDVVADIRNLQHLKELVVKAVGGDDSDCFLEDNQFYIKHMMEFCHFQKIFQKLIAITLPDLETWCVKNVSFDEFYLNGNDAFLGLYFTNIKELRYINVFRSMAMSYPKLKHVKIEMDKSVGQFSLHEILTSFPHLETLTLDVSIDYGSRPFPMHRNMKELAINRIAFHHLIQMMELMPNLQRLEITDRESWIPFDSYLVDRLHQAIPKFLSNLRLTFGIIGDFDRNSIKTLHEIVAGLQSYRLKLMGNCDFNALSEAIDKSIKREKKTDNSMVLYK